MMPSKMQNARYRKKILLCFLVLAVHLLWSGLAWAGLVWCEKVPGLVCTAPGLVRSGLAWAGLVWCEKFQAWSGLAWPGLVWNAPGLRVQVVCGMCMLRLGAVTGFSIGRSLGAFGLGTNVGSSLNQKRDLLKTSIESLVGISVVRNTFS